MSQDLTEEPVLEEFVLLGEGGLINLLKAVYK